MTELLMTAGPAINEVLSATIATIAGSFFLYSLFKDFGSRVARAFSLLLLFVTITYIGDLGQGFTSSPAAADPWLRFQWLGIAFVPAAYVHLSHAILEMTGLFSRGRRRWLVQLMYLLAAVFLALVYGDDMLVSGIEMLPAAHFQPGPLFPAFVAYFFGAVIIGLWFVNRARQRTLTRSTRRRLDYLLLSYAAPALAVFPFLLISGEALRSPLLFYTVLTLADALLAVMLSFMAYSMAFIGSMMPERLVKAQMLQFFLRGPVVAIAALAVIIGVPGAGRVLGLPGEKLMPLLAVTVILFLQWAITLVRPSLERLLIYSGNQVEVRRIQQLEARLLTGADFAEALDTILTALCDYLRVQAAFVVSIRAAEDPVLEKAVGLDEAFAADLAAIDLSEGLRNGDLPVLEQVGAAREVFAWKGFWLLPLHVARQEEEGSRLVGLIGIEAPAAHPEALEDAQWEVFMGLASRAAEVLEDRRIQAQVFATLEGLLPAMTTIDRLREAERHGGVAALAANEEVLSSPDFADKIKDALNHYWGGPNLTDSALMRLAVVRQALEEHEGNHQRAMRAVLEQAIENLRPEGQRSMTTAEWILYNILEMRFIQGRKVRDVAMRLAMSESDLYRKQRVAIESVADIIADKERSAARPAEPAEPPAAEPAGTGSAARP